MKGRIVIMRDGKISFFVDEGSLEEGKVALERFIKKMGLEGVEFSEIGQVEQHRHTHDGLAEHVHD